ncbi:MAG: hypothetical protein VB085_01755 [Peptococcaceae bacterium]|nr:hypothetical protein [Peptococcaceae bacterium]
MGKKKSFKWKLPAAFVLMLLFCLALSACTEKEAESSGGTGQLMEESGEGLFIDGEGPIPATLIARSYNHLSIQEDQQVLQELTQELDKLVETAGQMDQAISDESMNTEGIVSGQAPEDQTGEPPTE